MDTIEGIPAVTATDLRQRLVAIFAADAVGYSRLMAADERATVAALDAARALFRSHIEQRQGRVIDMAGDSVLAVFETATGAVSAALAIQQDLEGALAEVADVRHMRFRIGVHLGDIIEKSDGTIYGDGVNIAARLEALGEPGGITVSDAVLSAVRGKVMALFEDRGEQTVKNIAHPVRTYRVRASTGAIPVPAPAQGVPQEETIWRVRFLLPLYRLSAGMKRISGSKRALGGIGLVVAVLFGAWYGHRATQGNGTEQHVGRRPLGSVDPFSIVVLPFTNQTGDAQQDYVADGISEGLINELSRENRLVVVEPTTAFALKGKTVLARTVGKDLGVHFVLRGDVQRNGTIIRVNAQLIDANTAEQLWSSSFEDEQSRLFALQDLIVTRVGNAILPEMAHASIRERSAAGGNPSAVDLVLRAYALRSHPLTAANLEEQSVLFRQAMTLEPNNQRAIRGLAVALLGRANLPSSKLPEQTRQQMLEEGHALTLQLRALSPDDPAGHYLLGMYAYGEKNWDVYQRAFEGWAAQSPRSQNALTSYGDALLLGGEPREAIDVLTRALELEPSNPHRDIYNGLGYAYFLLGENDVAIGWLLKAVEQSPGSAECYANLALAYADKGENEKARAAVAQALRIDPGLTDPGPESWLPPTAFRYWEERELPAARKAGLPVSPVGSRE